MFSFVPFVLQGVPFWHSDAYCCYCYCCVVVVYVVVSCLRLSFLVLLLSLRCSPLLLLQVSDSSTFHIMCDVPSIAVFCSESVECLPGMATKDFLKPFVTIPVAAVVTGIILHLIFHNLCISIHKLSYFSFFSASVCITYSVCGYCHIYQCACFLFLFFVIIYGLFPVTPLSVFTAFYQNT